MYVHTYAYISANFLEIFLTNVRILCYPVSEYFSVYVCMNICISGEAEQGAQEMLSSLPLQNCPTCIQFATFHMSLLIYV